jgi:hypothetical protein
VNIFVNTQNLSYVVSGVYVEGFFRWQSEDRKVEVYLESSAAQLIERDSLHSNGKIVAGVLLGNVKEGLQTTFTVESYDAFTSDDTVVESRSNGDQLRSEPEVRSNRRKRSMAILGLYRTCGGERATIGTVDLMALEARLSPESARYCIEPAHVRFQMCKSPILNRFEPQTVFESQPVSCKPNSRSEIIEAAKQDKIDKRIAPIESRVTRKITSIYHDECEPAKVLLLIQSEPHQQTKWALFVVKNGEVQYEWLPVALDHTEFSRPKAVTKQSPRVQPVPMSYGSVANAVPPSLPNHLIHNVAPVTSEQFQSSDEWKQNVAAAVRSKWMLATVACSLAMVFILYSGGWARFASAFGLSDFEGDIHLGLKADRNGSDWIVSWDPDSPVFTKATSAEIVIEDGYIHKNLVLGPTELRNGRIIYIPVTDNATLQLNVVGPDSDEPVTETVHIVAGVLPPMNPGEFEDHKRPVSRKP